MKMFIDKTKSRVPELVMFFFGTLKIMRKLWYTEVGIYYHYGAWVICTICNKDKINIPQKLHSLLSANGWKVKERERVRK